MEARPCETSASRKITYDATTPGSGWIIAPTSPMSTAPSKTGMDCRLHAGDDRAFVIYALWLGRGITRLSAANWRDGGFRRRRRRARAPHTDRRDAGGRDRPGGRVSSVISMIKARRAGSEEADIAGNDTPAPPGSKDHHLP